MYLHPKYRVKIQAFFVFILFILEILMVTPVIAKEYEFLNYSVTGPQGGGWETSSIDKDKQQIIFNNRKKRASITIVYEPILDPEVFSNDIKAIADDKRDAEIAIMQSDPKTPVDKNTVKYDEEIIGGRRFYTMSYITETKPKCYGYLYCYISGDLKNNMYTGHLGIVEKKRGEGELFYIFKDILKSIIIFPIEPYKDAINRAQLLVSMFTTYVQQYDPKVQGEDAKKHLQRGYDLAMGNISKALELKPESSEAHFLKGYLYEFNHDMIRYGKSFPADMAISEYNKVIEIDPEYGNAYYCLGVIHYNIGNVDEAIMNYKKTVELNPTNNIASLYLYSAYEKKGLMKEAIEALEHAVAYWIGSKENKKEIENKIKELKARLN